MKAKHCEADGLEDVEKDREIRRRERSRHERQPGGCESCLGFSWNDVQSSSTALGPQLLRGPDVDAVRWVMFVTSVGSFWVVHTDKSRSGNGRQARNHHRHIETRRASQATVVQVDVPANWSTRWHVRITTPYSRLGEHARHGHKHRHGDRN